MRTVNELVRKTGVSKATLRALYYGKGKGVQFETLERVCEALDVEVGDIIEIKKNEAS
ncbi:helix-turn-helix domain-containing protein [Cohnella xylanilytica]|uniref:helix-turn-helix domain-containing protein n=1 Tax=Cohnella xylanilytica TaxID=557555 RepID=UPI0035E34B67